MHTDQLEIPWYKSTGGVILLSFISLVIIIVTAFGAMFTYYAWQIKFGDTRELENIFNPQITFNEKLSGHTKSELKDFHANSFVRPHNPTLGSKNSQITILAFIDFNCPFCKKTYADFDQITKKYEPVIKVVYKPIPLTSPSEPPYQAALAALCAADQDKFLYYHNLLFESKDLNLETLQKHSKNLKLDEQEFSTCLELKKHEQNISQDISDAIDLGLRGTPTYIINNTKIEGVLNQEQWDQLILTELDKIQ